MCGIIGMFDRSGTRSVAESNLRQMLAMLRHRGPDEFGILLDREAGLGSARLSIIDLSGGSQPIANEDQSLWIVFNGEIFNYIELRAELEPKGHRFRTSSDTEVILHLYEEFGPACLENSTVSLPSLSGTRRNVACSLAATAWACARSSILKSAAASCSLLLKSRPSSAIPEYRPNWIRRSSPRFSGFGPR